MPRHRFASIRSLAACVALTAAGPAVHAQLCAPFTDVALADGFCSSIQWMHNRGITLGCTTDQYCPADNVRRDQMAAFMFRLGNVVHQQGGNAFGATAVLGTTDGHPLDLRANGERVMRFEPNTISPNVIGGSPANFVAAGVRGGTVGGGGLALGDTDPDFPLGAPNRVNDAYGTVGGGYANGAGDNAGTTLDRAFASVGGGFRNLASGLASTVSGGSNNRASGSTAVVAGGDQNLADGAFSTVAGGIDNEASGLAGTVAGGGSNAALGAYSFAAGRRAKANANGCFVWADSSDADFTCGTANAFIVRATGGVVIRSGLAPVAGVVLPPGDSAWSPSSDRHGKDNVVPVDPRAVLERLVQVPIATWNYVSQAPQVRHMGPMAQDLHAAFGLGASDRHISTVDADGIALAAIQGLNAKLEARVAEQSREIAALRERLDALFARLAGGAEAPR